MKTTVDIPDDLLMDAMKFTKATTKRDAVVTALADYNRRQRMTLLTKHLGTCSELITPDELKTMRESN